MKRNPQSHKGDNGKVAIIGGSHLMHGAPILSALAAEASGCDLLFPCVPLSHKEVTKASSLNFIVHTFSADELTQDDVESILELLATMDSAVIGPGLARTDVTLDAIQEVISGATCDLVIDASGLQPKTLDHIVGKNVVLTPHLGELERMGISEAALSDIDATVVIKGPTDTVFSRDGSMKKIEGGNAGLTVGGTGDVLAGLIAGLIAQGSEHDAACLTACTVMKKAGEALFERKGFSFTASDVIGEIPNGLRVTGS
ncbi:MAG: NAD(P)H-hydrate dehydratase [bacterium]|nr:NAD(P)H-hydrate dehydratase [bacterium]